MKFQERSYLDLGIIPYEQFARAESDACPPINPQLRLNFLKYPLDPLDTHFNRYPTGMFTDPIDREIIVFNQIEDNFPSCN
jgi:hypothetical protein